MSAIAVPSCMTRWSITIGDDEIPDEDFIDILRPLIAQKRRQTRANSEYEMNMKLMRFAASRGFTIEQIRQCIDVEAD